MSEIEDEGKNKSERKKVNKEQSLYASYFGKRIAINSKNSTLKSRLISVVAALLALPAVGAFFYSASSFFKDPNRPIPLVKAPEGPHAVSVNGNKLSSDEKLIGQFGSWSAYVKGGVKDKSCYIVASNPAYKDRSFRIEHQPSWNWFSQVKYHHEDSLDPFKWIGFEINGETKWLFGNNGNRAWLEEWDQSQFFNAVKNKNINDFNIRLGEDMRVNFDISNLEAALALIDERCGASESVVQARDGMIGKFVDAKSDPTNKCLPYEVRYGSKCFFNHEAKAKWEREQLLKRQPDWRVARSKSGPNIFYAQVEGNIHKGGWLGFFNTIENCKQGALMFQINTDKVDNLDALKGKNINTSWNGKKLQVKMRASKKFSSTIAAMMEVTVQNVNDILRVHEDDKFIEMKLLDTDTILVEDYFDKPSNFWSLAGMKDALTKLVGLCSLNTQEAKAEKEEPKQETKKDEQVSLDGIRL
jgi:hypothetical protein